MHFLGLVLFWTTLIVAWGIIGIQRWQIRRLKRALYSDLDSGIVEALNTGKPFISGRDSGQWTVTGDGITSKDKDLREAFGRHQRFVEVNETPRLQ